MTAGAESGTLTLFPAGGLPTSTSISEHFMTSWHQDVRRTDVDVVTINGVVADAGSPHVGAVKIDVETAEADLLDGMQATVERCATDVICEVLTGWGAAERVEERRRRWGYAAYRLNSAGSVPVSVVPDVDANYFLTRRDADDVRRLNSAALGLAASMRHRASVPA